MTVPPVLLSVNVGLPKNVAWQGKTVYTGAWKQHFGRDDLGYGQFGENLTVDGLTDDEVCIGDRYRIGEADTDALLYLPGRDRAKLRAAVRIPALSPRDRKSVV